MKLFPLALAAILLLPAVHSASALTSDQGKYTSGPNASQFTDPDDKMPAFMVSPGNGSSGNYAYGTQAPAVTMDNGAVFGRPNQSNDAFERAYQHQQK